MLILRACPHCHGDLVLEEERTCGYLSCVQCGHVLSRAEERALGVYVSRYGVKHVVPLRSKRELWMPAERQPLMLGGGKAR